MNRTLRFRKDTMYFATWGEMDGFPDVLPLSQMAQGLMPRECSSPNPYVMAARIFIACEYVLRGSLGSFWVPSALFSSQLPHM
jgi:hypothetical protein